MKLNIIEKALMNNPVRALVQWRYESALMERLGGRVEGGRVLEIGCGRGIGTEIIFKRFGAKEVHAFDLDPDMVRKAGRRLFSYSHDRLRLFVGDVEHIDAHDASYDAVFDFGIVHHVPHWQHAEQKLLECSSPVAAFSLKKPLARHFLGGRIETSLFTQLKIGLVLKSSLLNWSGSESQSEPTQSNGSSVTSLQASVIGLMFECNQDAERGFLKLGHVHGLVKSESSCNFLFPLNPTVLKE